MERASRTACSGVSGGLALSSFPPERAFSAWNASRFKPYSHQTACRFAEKTRSFRPVGAGGAVPPPHVMSFFKDDTREKIKARWGKDGGAWGEGRPLPREARGLPSPQTNSAAHPSPRTGNVKRWDPSRLFACRSPEKNSLWARQSRQASSSRSQSGDRASGRRRMRSATGVSG